MNVCTIIAKNYVAQARVLARSFAEHHPDGSFWTLIIDDFQGLIDPAREPFQILTPADIGCDEFDEMAAIYSVLELSTAVKPWLLRHLMGQTGAPVTYLDPDIKIYRSLERLDQLAAEHGVVLIPHNAEPIPPDGKRPSQIDIMIAGVYNLGYVSLAPRPDVERLLDWWADRLRRDCRVDPVYGYFVDQRWFDLTPGFLTDFAILRDPEYNVAYWNLHSRELSHDGERYFVDGRPLAFYHFSGFKPNRPTELSTYQDRIALTADPVLTRLCAEYADEALRDGYDTARQWPYGYNVLPGGVPYDDTLRRLFQIAERRGEVTHTPFTPEGAREFLAWLGSQQPDAPKGVSRLLAYAYGTNEKLREAYPDLEGPDLGRLLEWLRTDGGDLVPALAHLPAPSGAGAEIAAARPGLPAELWGVNVVGYFRSELGVGEAGRQVIGALDAYGVPVLPVHGDTIPLSRQGHPYTQFGHADAEYPVNLICMNADALPEFAGQAGDWFFANRYSIGLWFWEVSRFRKEWMPSFEYLDEVWLPSAHVTEAVAAVSPIPTRTMRIPVEVPALVPRSRSELGLPGGFMFLFSFDYRSIFERKNPLAVVQAFKRAFAHSEGAALVIKCINADADPDNHQRLLAAAEEHPDIHVVDRYFTPEDKNTLTALCDCYVSLHRAEGFGYTMAEAMYLGKPVIATAYSGNLDFMTEQNSLLVKNRMVPIGLGADPYPADGEWAEPDVEHAAMLMRRVFDDREHAAAVGAQAAQDIRRTHSPAAVGELMVARLEELRANRDSWETGTPSSRWSRVVRTLRRRVEYGAQGFKPSTVARRAARQSVLRVMQPFTAYQETVNQDVTRSLDVLGRELDRTRVRLARSNAAILAKLRQQEALVTLPKILEVHSRQIDDVKEAAFATRYQTDRSLYLALSELRRAHERIGEEPRREGPGGELTAWELRAFSQNGEDGVLAEILARVGAPTRYFVEFGIEDGREGNCVFLADVAGWRGLFMEGDGARFGELARKYESNEGVTTREAMVRPDNVQDLFRQAGVPGEPDVLSIDVDGSDYWIWDAIAEYRPRVVIIEYNSALDPARKLVQPRDAGTWDGTDYYGASLGAVRCLGEEKGYRLVHAELSGVNAFLVREDLAEGRFPAADEVAVRVPNYFQSGYRHPADPHNRRYLDLETGEMVPAASTPASAPASVPANNGAAAPSVASSP